MTYPTVIIADGPSAYWRLGEASGSTSEDISGNNQDITWVAAPIQGQAGAIDGDSDTAVAFEGADYGSFPDSAVTKTAAVTVECWLKVSTLPGVGVLRAILDRMAGADGYALMLYGGDLSFRTNGGFGTVSANYPTDGEWHHVAGTFSISTGLHLYIDGVQSQYVDYTTAIAYSGVRANVGRLSTSYYLDDCIVDELAIYPAALTSVEVSNHYVAGTSPPAGTEISIEYSHPIGYTGVVNTLHTNPLSYTLTVVEGAVSNSGIFPLGYTGVLNTLHTNPLSYTLTVVEGAVSNIGVFPLGYSGVVVSPHKFPMEWSGIASPSTFVLGNPNQFFDEVQSRVWEDTPKPRQWYA